jgi:hypothetical protein
MRGVQKWLWEVLAVGRYAALVCAVLGCALSVCSQTPPEPVPSNWLRDGKLVAEEYNFSIDSPSPNSHWSYSRLADIEGSKATAFTVEDSIDTKFAVVVWDKSSSTDSGTTKSLVDGMEKSMPKEWRIDDAKIEPSAFPLKDSSKLKITIHTPDQATVYAYGYVVTGDRTYALVDYSPETAEPPQFKRFVGSFAFLSPPNYKSRLLVIAALLAFVLYFTRFVKRIPEFSGGITTKR